MSFRPILTPCIGVCALDDRGYCLGCRRTALEIAHWSQMDDDQRLRFLGEILPQREAAAQ
ncbi:MAG TPA: DUF1289 domain-containing protein [Xanthomonadaceae bacterium]|nr:DUF1289 domain-containing protein [Xanthomonadaceae bacterium]